MYRKYGSRTTHMYRKYGSRTTHMYRKYGSRTTQERLSRSSCRGAVVEEQLSKSDSFAEKVGEIFGLVSR
jgi:hypothetical protein